MKHSTSETVIRFPDVVPAAEPLPELSLPAAVRHFLEGRREHGYRMEGCCSWSGMLIQHVDVHPFFAALHRAWTEHRPLRITPDAIWLLISHGAARHIALNSETLRRRFVNHEGQQDLVILVDAGQLIPGSPENRWEHFAELFAQKLQQTAGMSAEVFVPQFTTTGPWEKAAFEVALMKAMQPWYRYRLGRVICGIPWLTIAGTTDDWSEILTRIRRLRSLLDMNWWLDPLERILNQFIDCTTGCIDEGFWRSIFRLQHPAGPCVPESATGWSACFWPYLGRNDTLVKNPWLTGERNAPEMWNTTDEGDLSSVSKDGDAEFRGLLASSLPTGITQVPFELVDYDLSGTPLETRSMEFVAGFIGISQAPGSLELTPQIGWAVGRQTAAHNQR